MHAGFVGKGADEKLLILLFNLANNSVKARVQVFMVASMKMT
jgi:hypothetical protein